MTDLQTHLTFIQNLIDRFCRLSFELKGWSVWITIITGFGGLIFHYPFAVYGMVWVMVLWLLDAYFLLQERAYRILYDEVRVEKKAEYNMYASTKGFLYTKDYWVTVSSFTLYLFYIVQLCVLAISLDVLK